MGDQYCMKTKEAGVFPSRKLNFQLLILLLNRIWNLGFCAGVYPAIPA